MKMLKSFFKHVGEADKNIWVLNFSFQVLV